MKKFIKNLFFEEVEDNTSESTQQSTNISAESSPTNTAVRVVSGQQDEYNSDLYSKLLTKVNEHKKESVSYQDFIKIVNVGVNVDAFPDPTKSESYPKDC